MLLNPSSPCYLLSLNNKYVDQLFNTHGLKTAHGPSSWAVKRRLLVIHLLRGDCASSSSDACMSIATGRTPISIRADFLTCARAHIGTPRLPDSAFRSLCLLLGINCSVEFPLGDLFLQFETLLGQPSCCQVLTGDLPPLAQTLNDSELLSLADLQSLLGHHQLPYNLQQTCEVLRNLFWHHLTTSSCFSDDTDRPDGCKHLTSHFPPTYLDSLTVGISIIVFAERFCNVCILKRILSLKNVAFGEHDSVQHLRERLLSHVSSTVAGRRILIDVRRGIASCNNWIGLNQVRTQWPTVLTEDFQEQLIHTFLEETSSKSLAFHTCASCSEKVVARDSILVQDTELDLNALTRPDKHSLLRDGTHSVSEWLHSDVSPPHIPSSSVKWPYALLDPKGVICDQTETKLLLTLCLDCHRYLSKGLTPPCALANLTYVGDQPSELKDLRPFEEAMIALSRGVCTILQLREKDNGPCDASSQGICPPNIQKGLRGHSIIFPQQPQTISNILPPSIEEILAPICVIFVGDKPPSKAWIMEKATPLAVRGNKVCLSTFNNHDVKIK